MPGAPDQEFDMIDVRDIAEWSLRMVESDHTGIHNAGGLPSHETIESVLRSCKSVSRSNSSWKYVTAEFLKAHDIAGSTVNAWYIDDDDECFRYIWDVDYAEAIASGLTFRPLSETIRATLEWVSTLPPDWHWKVGLKPEV